MMTAAFRTGLRQMRRRVEFREQLSLSDMVTF